MRRACPRAGDRGGAAQAGRGGRARTLILNGQLARGEQTLAQLACDPASSLAASAAALRSVNELRAELEKLQTLLRELGVRARTLRAACRRGLDQERAGAWLAASR